MRPAARLRWLLAQVLLRLSRWRTSGEVPRKGILVGSPHTSNWDWVLTMLLAWDSGVTIRLLVKQEFFKGPVGWLLLRTGAVPLDRANPGATIRRLVEDSATDDTFLLGIAAEGTRSKVEFWKSGFYRISQQTGLPVTLAFVDGPSRTVGWGPTFPLSGDMRVDMDRVRAFYADKTGIRPELQSVPRLREEDQD